MIFWRENRFGISFRFRKPPPISRFDLLEAHNDNEPLLCCLFNYTYTHYPPTCQNIFIMLWVDKHRPSKLEDLSYHENITQRLQSLTANPAAMPHLFFYGPPGSGKKTRITALLRSLYGPGAERLKLDRRTFTTPTKRTVEINMITSNYHIELSPGDAGLNDRFVVQDIIKEMAANRNIASVAGGEKKAAGAQFKTVVLMEVDQLSRQAQAALRRTMEKYASSCRLILCCNSQSKVIEPVRSRCLGIRIGAPTADEVSPICIDTTYAFTPCCMLHQSLIPRIVSTCHRSAQSSRMLL